MPQAARTGPSWRCELVRTSTTFISCYKNGKRWTVRKQIDGVTHLFHSQPCEDKAAALHGIATIWSLLRKHGTLRCCPQ